MIGPGLGAILAATIGVNSIFVLDAVTSAAAAAFIAPVTVRHMAKTKGESRGFQDLKEGFLYTYGHRRLRFYIWLGSSVWLLFGTFSALEPLFFRDILEVEIETLGWVNSIFGLGLVGGTAIASRLPSSFRNARWLTFLVGMNAAGVLAYIGTDRLQIVVVAGVFWGVIVGMMAPLHRTMIQLNSPDDLVGRIQGVNHIHSEVGHLIPLAMAGAFGVQATLIGAGIAVAVVALLFARTAGQLDRTRDVEVPSTGLPDPSDEPRSVGH